jgi:N-acetylmuramoyl-L-alanine amidase
MTEDHPELRAAVRALPARVPLALTCYAEAANQSVAGRAAVCWVIRNRSSAWKQSIADVCMNPAQFSCWNPGPDANHQRLMARAALVVAGKVMPDAGWLETLRIADDVLAGRTADPTGSALYYCTAQYLADPTKRGDWFQRQVRKGRLVPSTTIGDHVFFTEAPPEAA